MKISSIIFGQFHFFPFTIFSPVRLCVDSHIYIIFYCFLHYCIHKQTQLSQHMWLQELSITLPLVLWFIIIHYTLYISLFFHFKHFLLHFLFISMWLYSRARLGSSSSSHVFFYQQFTYSIVLSFWYFVRILLEKKNRKRETIYHHHKNQHWIELNECVCFFSSSLGWSLNWSRIFFPVYVCCIYTIWMFITIEFESYKVNITKHHQKKIYFLGKKRPTHLLINHNQIIWSFFQILDFRFELINFLSLFVCVCLCFNQ